MWKQGKRQKTGCHFLLVLFRGDILIDDQGDKWLTDENEILEEFYEWDELESWLADNKASTDEVHLAICAETVGSEYFIATAPQTADYWSAVIVDDIRNAKLTDDFKRDVEDEAYRIRLEKIQRAIGILGKDGVIDEIIIRNLFGKIDAYLNLNQPISILIGANGIGKTTIVKLVNNYFNTNYIDIVAAPFDQIEYIHIDDAQDIYSLEDREYYKEVFQYNDFFPDKKIVIDSFVSELEEYRRKNPSSESNNRIDMRYIKLVFSGMLDELEKKGLYGQFIYCSYKNKSYSRRIKRIIDKWELDKSVIEELAFVKKTDLNMRKKVFSGAAIERIVNGREANASDMAVYYIDFVESIRLDNNDIQESEFYSSLVNGLGKIHAQMYYTKNGDTILTYSPGVGMMDYDPHYVLSYEAMSSVSRMSKTKEEFNNSRIDVKETPINIDTYRNITSTRFDNNNTYKIWDVFGRTSTDLRILSEMTNTNVFAINSIINQNYYEDSFIININNQSLDRITEFFDLIDHDESLLENDAEREYEHAIDKLKELRTDYEEYVRPTLIRDSFYSIDINNLGKSIETKLKGGKIGYRERVFYLKTLIRFVEDVLPLLKDESNKSDKIKLYEKTIKKYLIGKYISITPSGIVIRDSLIERDQSKTIVIYDEDEIDLSVVSSGEKKILILFALQIFYSNFMFLLDEPELSLSILWQESLVPDLVSCGSNHFIIATHSPYIAASESVRDYINFMPQEKV